MAWTPAFAARAAFPFVITVLQSLTPYVHPSACPPPRWHLQLGEVGEDGEVPEEKLDLTLTLTLALALTLTLTLTLTPTYPALGTCSSESPLKMGMLSRNAQRAACCEATTEVKMSRKCFRVMDHNCEGICGKEESA